MKFYGRPFAETTKANAGKLELALALFREKLVNNAEAALRLDTPLFRAFHNFSNSEVEAALEEAKKAGSDTVVLEASVYLDAAAEAEALAAVEAAKPKPATAPAPEPAPVAAPEVEPETTSFTPDGEAPQSGSNEPTN